MKTHADILMDTVLDLLAQCELPQSPAPHLEPDNVDDEAWETMWRELGKHKDSYDDPA